MFRYPKITLLALCIIVAYLFFNNPLLSAFFLPLSNLGYIGTFIAGILYSFGFTSPFAVGILAHSVVENYYLASILAGLGALVADMTLFTWVRFSLSDEFIDLKRRFEQNRIVEISGSKIPPVFKKIMIYVVAGIVISSPLPDEIGVSLLSGLTKIKPLAFAAISFFLNAAGVLVIFWLLH